MRWRKALQSLLLRMRPCGLNDLGLWASKINAVSIEFLRRKPFAYKRHGTLSLHFNFMAIQSEMLCAAPNDLIVPYTRTMMGFLLFAPLPEKIVMIGLGGGSLAKYCHAKLPHASVVVTEIDPEVIALRNLFCVPPDGKRFRVLCEDGALFVRNESNSIDVLLVDGFDLHGQSAQLCTQTFYDDCYMSLAPDGMIVINLPAEDPNLERSVARIRRRFRNAVVVDSEDFTNRVVFASKGQQFDLPFEQLCARLAALELLHPVGLRETLQLIRFELYETIAVMAAGYRASA
jgi:spermidine synthase